MAQPPFQYPNLTDREQRTLAPGSYGSWRVGGPVFTETATVNTVLVTPTYSQLPYSRIQIDVDYTLPSYTQDFWRPKNTPNPVSFFVFLENTSLIAVNVNPGPGWSLLPFAMGGQSCALLLVMDNGTNAVAVSMGNTGGTGGGGSFTVSTVGPIVASTPVVLGGNLALNNTALNSIATNSWKAGSTSSVGLQNDVSVGHGATSNMDAVAVGYLAAAGQNSVTVGAQATSAGNDEVSIGHNAVAQNLGSVAVGSGTLATGTTSVAVGYQASAQNTRSTAVGATAGADLVDGVAVGYSALANTTSVAVGSQCTSGLNAVSVGYLCLATTRSVVVGAQANTTGIEGVAVGYDSLCFTDATALGFQASASGNSSIAIGKTSSASDTNSTAIGNTVVNAVPSTTLIGEGGAGADSHEVISTGYLRALNPAVFDADFPLQITAEPTTPAVYVNFTTNFNSGGIQLFSPVTIQLPRSTDTTSNCFMVNLSTFGPLSSLGNVLAAQTFEVQESYIVDGVFIYTNVTVAVATNTLSADVFNPIVHNRIIKLAPAGTVHVLRYRAYNPTPSFSIGVYVQGHVSIYRCN